MSIRVILTLIQKDWRSFARNIPLILNTALRSCKLSQTSLQLIHNFNTAYSVKLRGRHWEKPWEALADFLILIWSIP